MQVLAQRARLTLRKTSVDIRREMEAEDAPLFASQGKEGRVHGCRHIQRKVFLGYRRATERHVRFGPTEFCWANPTDVSTGARREPAALDGCGG